MTEFFTHYVESQASIKLMKAILLHELTQADAPRYSNQGHSLIASEHEFVQNGEGKLVVGAGALMGYHALENLLKTILNHAAQQAVLLPPSVVSVSHAHVAWTTPAAVRPMLFKPVGAKPKTLTVPWPRLLMIANNSGQFAVAALASNRQIAHDTKLYHAPLMNVDRHGRVCTGNALLPTQCDTDHLADWEAVMFDTAFTHVNHPHSLKANQDTDAVETKACLKFWSVLARQKVERFPNRALNPLGMSMTDFISRHA